MFDAWMNMWTKGPETMVNGWTAMNDAVPSVTDGDMPMWLTSMSTPVMAPAMVGAVVANTAAATWAGLVMSAPLAGAAAYSALTGEGSARAAKPKTKTKVTVQPATKAAVNAATPKATTPKTASSKPAAKGAAKPASAKPAGAKQPAPKLDDRPSGLDAPKGGKADDLKQISGVGPKLESVLNDLGIYHFDQIAAWTKKEIAWVDDYLRFKGRIDRDGWIGQAKTLAKEAA
jgi:predicted flap endonuclease-1-like 5' DNA nuclease